MADQHPEAATNGTFGPEQLAAAQRAPEPGRFERGVFIPARLDELGDRALPYDLDDPDDVTGCGQCPFRCLGLAAMIRHAYQEHAGDVD